MTSPDVQLTVDELVVHGWSRRRTDRFLAALEPALVDAFAQVLPGPGTVRDGEALALRLDRTQRRDPEAAAAAVAAALAAAVRGEEVGP